MKTLLSAAALATMLAVLGGTAGAALAQTLPSGPVVQASNGSVYMLTPAGRYHITPAPISDEDLAAMPDLGDLSGDLLATPTTTMTQAQVAQEPITLSGVGQLNTRPFALQSGNYSITWVATAEPGSRLGCYFSATLKPVSKLTGFYGESIGNGEAAAQQPYHGETQVYSVPTGSFYLDANTTCGWAITIQPQH